MTVSYRKVQGVCTLLAIFGGVTCGARSASAMPNPPAHVLVSREQVGLVAPMIVAGDPAGAPTDNPGLHVDLNTTTSTFAGVGSLFIDAAPVGDNQGYLCSGCAIHGFTLGKTVVRNYVLAAAHCLDFAGGIDEANNPTGDGTPDVAPSNVTFFLNYGGNITSQIKATEIHLFPDWHGFDNVNGPEGASINDDVALIRLATPVPVGVPVYNLSTTFAGNAEAITSVGYGESGSPTGINVNASFSTKRVGKNQADAVGNDDEGPINNTNFEVFEADFDGPTSATNVFDIGPLTPESKARWGTTSKRASPRETPAAPASSLTSTRSTQFLALMVSRSSMASTLSRPAIRRPMAPCLAERSSRVMPAGLIR